MGDHADSAVYHPDHTLQALDLKGLRGNAGFFVRADAVAAFVARERRFPKKSDADATAVLLAEWLANQRQYRHGRGVGVGSFTDERKAYLDRVAPGWDVMRKTDSFEDSAAATANWARENGRLPSEREGASEEELMLGKFVNAARTAATSYRRDPEKRSSMLWNSQRQLLLDTLLPNWDRPLKVRKDFEAMVDELADFVARWERWPAGASSTTAPPEERSLGTWLANRKSDGRKGSLSPERTATLDRRVPGWNATLRKRG